MDQPNLFSYAHPLFFDTMSRYSVSREFVDPLKALLPENSVLHRWDVWVGAGYEGAVVPGQGFKIHVSSSPLQALRVLELVVPELVRRGITFKIAGDPRLLGLLISKRFGREGSGKFMTIYPPDDEAFRELIEALYLVTRDEGLSGPYILFGPQVPGQPHPLLPVRRDAAGLRPRGRRRAAPHDRHAHRRVRSRPAGPLLPAPRLGGGSLRRLA